METWHREKLMNSNDVKDAEKQAEAQLDTWFQRVAGFVGAHPKKALAVAAAFLVLIVLARCS